MELVQIDSVVTRTENPYVKDVAELIAATNAYLATPGVDTSKTPAGQFTVSNGEAAKTVFYIQQAAIEQGVTARIASKLLNGVNKKGNPTRTPAPDVDADGVATGQTMLLFKITPKRKENGRAPRAAK